ncbi:UNVERIFIED_CONTAM: hypothetical protein Slati_0975200 [Sesamum latifolium]|uniref:Uncharacterized protein n=1 Tax=Sesamum latifolium TaxID=2727402 RepID=A0AAW2XX83_9LAMI
MTWYPAIPPETSEPGSNDLVSSDPDQRPGIQRSGIQRPGTSDLVSSDPDQRPGIRRPGPETWYPATQNQRFETRDPKPETWYPATWSPATCELASSLPCPSMELSFSLSFKEIQLLKELILN